MAQASEPVRILLIRSWTQPLAPLRAVLREHGITAHFFRVDIEPALNAALSRGGYHVIVYDPQTQGITRDTLDARLRDHKCSVAVIELGRHDDLPDAIARVLVARLN